ncbi:MAG: 3'-5' exonuclease [Bacteroidales bacterium]
MLNDIKLTNILFLDIETVPAYPALHDVPENLQKLWLKKANSLSDKETSPEEVYNKAGIYAEFGKIICISAGFFYQKNDANKFRVKSFYGDDEKQVLVEFSKLLRNSFNSADNYLCAHNGKEFDFPYISRRCLIHGIPLPKMLDNAGKKPWETRHLDTMELWKFGDYKHYTSLNLLTTIFNIPSPKDDIDGSDVWKVYWVDKDLTRIVTYCQKDVVAVAQLYLRYNGLQIMDESDIEIV